MSGYDGCHLFTPEQLIDCGSLRDVQDAVRKASTTGRQVRAIGAGLSWAHQIRCSDVALRLTGLDRLVALDPGSRTIRLQAGVRLGDATRMLAEYGLALPSLPFLPDMTVGGAVSTGTHGTSLAYGTVSDQVRAIRLVTATGDLLVLEPNSPLDLLRAARVSIGLLGVIVEVELEAVPMPFVQHFAREMSLDAFLADWSDVVRCCTHVWVRWPLCGTIVRVNGLHSSSVRRIGAVPYVLDRGPDWAGDGRRSALDNRLRRLARSLRPRRGSVSAVTLSMQYGLPIELLPACLAQLCSSSFGRRHAGRELEIKFLRGSDASLLGPNVSGDTALFNLYWRVERTEIATIFAGFETLMRGLDARPHWGKLHTIPTPTAIARMFPDWQRFEQARSMLDPNGIFSWPGWPNYNPVSAATTNAHSRQVLDFEAI